MIASLLDTFEEICHENCAFVIKILDNVDFTRDLGFYSSDGSLEKISISKISTCLIKFQHTSWNKV